MLQVKWYSHSSRDLAFPWKVKTTFTLWSVSLVSMELLWEMRVFTHNIFVPNLQLEITQCPPGDDWVAKPGAGASPGQRKGWGTGTCQELDGSSGSGTEAALGRLPPEGRSLGWQTWKLLSSRGVGGDAGKRKQHLWADEVVRYPAWH